MLSGGLRGRESLGQSRRGRPGHISKVGNASERAGHAAIGLVHAGGVPRPKAHDPRLQGAVQNPLICGAVLAARQHLTHNPPTFLAYFARHLKSGNAGLTLRLSPMPSLSDDQVAVSGRARTVAYAKDSQGRMPAKDFLDQTSGSDSLSKVEKRGMYHIFRLMADNGKIANAEQFRKERGEIYGFKKYQARFAAFQVGSVWYLTHGFKKKKDKWPEAELDRADRIRSEHLRRGESDK